MNTYIKPTIKVKTMKSKETMLANSITMGTSDTPATHPANSKSFFDMGATTTETPASSATSTNIWEEEC